MDNGLLQVTLSNPDGIVTGIRFSDIDNLLEVLNDESNRGYDFTLLLHVETSFPLRIKSHIVIIT